jgi:hypothetical protein
MIQRQSVVSLFVSSTEASEALELAQRLLRMVGVQLLQVDQTGDGSDQRAFRVLAVKSERSHV